MRELTNLLAAIAKVKAEGCKCDNGAVWGCATCDNPDCDCGTSRTKKPCPTCAKLREMAEWKWHEVDDSEIQSAIMKNTQAWITCSCDNKRIRYEDWASTEHFYHANHTFTVQSIRGSLEVLEEWEGFINWHGKQCESNMPKGLYGTEIIAPASYILYMAIWVGADILTSDPLMVEAAKAYLTQRLEEMR